MEKDLLFEVVFLAELNDHLTVVAGDCTLKFLTVDTLQALRVQIHDPAQFVPQAEELNLNVPHLLLQRAVNLLNVEQKRRLLSLD